MTEIKKCFRLLRYSDQIKVTLIGGGFILLYAVAIGLLFDGWWSLGWYFVVMAGGMVPALARRLLSAEYIAASPKRRILEIRFQDILCLLTVIGEWAVIVGVGHFCGGTPCWLMPGLWIGGYGVYLTLANKANSIYMLLVVIVFGVALVATLFLLLNDRVAEKLLVDSPQMAFAGVGLSVLGYGIDCLLRRLLYKWQAKEQKI